MFEVDLAKFKIHGYFNEDVRMANQCDLTGLGRYLITTADERSWKFDRPVLFLGEWCLRHSRRHVWQAMDAEVAIPYGLAADVRDQDHIWARKCEELLFPLLCDVLNRHHGTSHSQRYWRILLGHWFRRYIEALINRYQTLNACLQTYHPSGVMIHSKGGFAFASQDSDAAIWAYCDANWNAHLYAGLLRYMDTVGLHIEENSSIAETDGDQGGLVASSTKPPSVIRSIARRVLDVAMCLSRDEDAVISNSYLPRRTEMLLNLSLGQWPQRLGEHRIDQSAVSVDQIVRDKLSAELWDAQATGLNRALRGMLFELIPVCFLEGYEDLVKAAEALPWPHNPKFIFTSNNFDTDELFKTWAATKVEAGAPYVVGQHGANYGTSRYMNPSVEEITSDKFITWGWEDGLSQHTRGFIFKTCGKKKQTYDPKGGLLLIELHSAQMLTTWDSVAEYAGYFEEQLRFCGGLQPGIREQVTVRLQHTLKDLAWNVIDRWQEYDPSIKLENGSCKLNTLLATSRLVIHSYDSTGILETLDQNIPTMAFWQNGLNHLRESARPYYQRLVDAGILHLSPQSAAAHINTFWENIDEWWDSPSVQAARVAFCSRYARPTSHPVREMSDILRTVRRNA